MDNREHFVAEMNRVIAAHPDARLMLVLDNGDGLITMQSTPNFIWMLGALKSALIMTEEKYREAQRSTSAQSVKEIENLMLMAAAIPDGKAN